MESPSHKVVVERGLSADDIPVVVCNPLGDPVRRLTRAARWVTVNSCITLNLVLKLPSGVELAVPCIEGMTSVGELHQVVGFYYPELKISSVTLTEHATGPDARPLPVGAILSEHCRNKSTIWVHGAISDAPASSPDTASTTPSHASRRHLGGTPRGSPSHRTTRVLAPEEFSDASSPIHNSDHKPTPPPGRPADPSPTHRLAADAQASPQAHTQTRRGSSDGGGPSAGGDAAPQPRAPLRPHTPSRRRVGAARASPRVSDITSPELAGDGDGAGVEAAAGDSGGAHDDAGAGDGAGDSGEGGGGSSAHGEERAGGDADVVAAAVALELAVPHTTSPGVGTHSQQPPARLEHRPSLLLSTIAAALSPDRDRLDVTPSHRFPRSSRLSGSSCSSSPDAGVPAGGPRHVKDALRIPTDGESDAGSASSHTRASRGGVDRVPHRHGRRHSRGGSGAVDRDEDDSDGGGVYGGGVAVSDMPSRHVQREPHKRHGHVRRGSSGSGEHHHHHHHYHPHAISSKVAKTVGVSTASGGLHGRALSVHAEGDESGHSLKGRRASSLHSHGSGSWVERSGGDGGGAGVGGSDGESVTGRPTVSSPPPRGIPEPLHTHPRQAADVDEMVRTLTTDDMVEFGPELAKKLCTVLQDEPTDTNVTGSSDTESGNSSNGDDDGDHDDDDDGDHDDDDGDDGDDGDRDDDDDADDDGGRSDVSPVVVPHRRPRRRGFSDAGDDAGDATAAGGVYQQITAGGGSDALRRSHEDGSRRHGFGFGDAGTSGGGGDQGGAARGTDVQASAWAPAAAPPASRVASPRAVHTGVAHLGRVGPGHSRRSSKSSHGSRGSGTFDTIDGGMAGEVVVASGTAAAYARQHRRAGRPRSAPRTMAVTSPVITPGHAPSDSQVSDAWTDQLASPTSHGRRSPTANVRTRVARHRSVGGAAARPSGMEQLLHDASPAAVVAPSVDTRAHRAARGPGFEHIDTGTRSLPASPVARGFPRPNATAATTTHATQPPPGSPAGAFAKRHDFGAAAAREPRRMHELRHHGDAHAADSQGHNPGASADDGADTPAARAERALRYASAATTQWQPASRGDGSDGSGSGSGEERAQRLRGASGGMTGDSRHDFRDRYRGVSGTTMQQVPPTSQVMARAAELLRQVINREDSATPSPLAAHSGRGGVGVGMLGPSHLGDPHYSSPPAHHPRYGDPLAHYQAPPQRRAPRGSDAGGAAAGAARLVDGHGYGSSAYGAERGGSRAARHSTSHHTHGRGGSVRGLGAGMLGGDRMGGAAGVAPASLVHAHAAGHHLQPHGSGYSFKSGSSSGYGPRRGPSASRLHGTGPGGSASTTAKRGSRRPSRGSGKSRGNPRLRVKGMGKAVHAGGVYFAGPHHAQHDTHGPAQVGHGHGRGVAHGVGGGDGAHAGPGHGHGRDTRVISAAVRALDVVEHLPMARASDVSNGLFVPGGARGAAVAASSSVATGVGSSASRTGHSYSHGLSHGPTRSHAHGHGHGHASSSSQPHHHHPTRRHGDGDAADGAAPASTAARSSGKGGARPHSGKLKTKGSVKRGTGKAKKASSKKKTAKGSGKAKRRGHASSSTAAAAASSNHVTDASAWMRGPSNADA